MLLLCTGAIGGAILPPGFIPEGAAIDEALEALPQHHEGVHGPHDDEEHAEHHSPRNTRQ